MEKVLTHIQHFKEANPTFDWHGFSAWEKEAFNGLIGSELSKETEEHSEEAIKDLQAYQRVYRLTKEHAKTEKLIEAGYHSAIQIANLAKHEFVKEAAPLFTSNGTSAEAQAEAIHQAAVSKKSHAVLTFTNIMQQNEKHYKNARFANMTTEGSGLENLPSYADLFGNVDFCSCESCRSIFSPAAYFVDLMRMQAKYILPKMITDKDGKEVEEYPEFDLKTRRPDLWDVELSCENTNTEISKLEIVNEVLEKISGHKFSSSIELNTENEITVLDLPLNDSLKFKAKSDSKGTYFIDKPKNAQFKNNELSNFEGTFSIDFTKKHSNNKTLNTTTNEKEETVTCNIYFKVSWAAGYEPGHIHPLIITCSNGSQISFKHTHPALLLSEEDNNSTSQHQIVTITDSNNNTYTAPYEYGILRIDLIKNIFTINGIPVEFKNSNSESVHFKNIDLVTEPSIEKIEMNNDASWNAEYKNLLFKGYNPYDPTIATSEPYPWNMPFNYQMVKVQSILKSQKTSLPEIWNNLKSSSTKPSKTELKSIQTQQLDLSNQQWSLYSVPKTDANSLAGFYGEKRTFQLKTLNNVYTFQKQTNLSREELDDLLVLDLSDEELKRANNPQKNFYINQGQDNVLSIKDGKFNIDLSEKENLIYLDRINRFVRLAHAINWSFAELDWALATIHKIVPTGDAIENGLAYLAWIQNVKTKHGLSVYEACAALGSLRDIGDKNHPTFYATIFENTHIPNAEVLQNNPEWNVPQLGVTTKEGTDKKILNALAAALKMNPLDVLKLANAYLDHLSTSTPDKNEATHQIQLSKDKLALFYRWSLIPKITGWTIDYLTNKGLIVEFKSAFDQLLNNNAADSIQGFNTLTEYHNWLITTHFTPYHLQYILTGDHTTPDIQNGVLGNDTIANFNQSLYTAIKPSLLTKSHFINALHSALNSAYDEKCANTVYGKLLTEKPEGGANFFIDQNGLVLNIPTASEIETWCNVVPKISKDAFPNMVGKNHAHLTPWEDLVKHNFITPIPPKRKTATIEPDAFNIDKLSKALINDSYTEANINQIERILNRAKNNAEISQTLTELIISTLKHAKIKQQNTFHQQLSGLYGISHEYLGTLLEHSSISLSDIITYESSDKTTSPPDIASLQLMQRYVDLVKHLGMSAAEVISINSNPKYYGFTKEEDTKGQLFTLENIQTFTTLKQLIASFGDSQNHLINYFQFVANHPVIEGNDDSLEKSITLLTSITQWDSSQIRFLITQLKLKEKVNGQARYGTVSGVALLKAYFDTSKKLSVDIASVVELKNLYSKSEKTDYSDTADALWSGYIHAKDQQEIALTNYSINGKKRDALVPVVIHQLNNNTVNLNLQTPRDLYEYLLLDVEVEGVVQTSRVKEAISTVQLYIYRTLNNLNPAQPTVDEELIDWWPWMQYYRSWQANREVFLYPENYIEPQLRKNKSPQFNQLESDLQQADLTNEESIVHSFNKYMDGFAQIANLTIVGAGMYDINTEQKEIFLVGQSSAVPYSYHYLIATFNKIGDNYEPQWDYWKPITCHMQPFLTNNQNFEEFITLNIKHTDAESDDLVNTNQLVVPYYENGKWHIYWAERRQVGSEQSGDKSVKVEKDFAKYAYLTNTKSWSKTHQANFNLELLEGLENITVFEDIDGLKTVIGQYNESIIVKKENELEVNELVPSLGSTFSLMQVTKIDELYYIVGLCENEKAFYYAIVNDLYHKINNAVFEKFDLSNLGIPSFIQLFKNKDLISGLGIINNNLLKISNLSDKTTTSLEKDFEVQSFFQARNLIFTDDSVVSSIIDYKPYYFDNPNLKIEKGKFSIFDGKKIISSDDTKIKNVIGTLSKRHVFNAYSYNDRIYLVTNTHPLKVFQHDVSRGADYYQLVDINFSDYFPLKNQFNNFSFVQGTKSPKLCYQTAPLRFKIVDIQLEDEVTTNTNIEKNDWYLLQEKGEAALKYPYNHKAANDRVIHINTSVLPTLETSLSQSGIKDLLDINNQNLPDNWLSKLPQLQDYYSVAPTDRINFFDGPMANYFWELFFHSPYLIANTLQNQLQFEQAKKWYQYIFNPSISSTEIDLSTDTNKNDKYWNFVGLKASSNKVLQLELTNSPTKNYEDDLSNKSELAQYHYDPFDPHAIARLRPIAYQKSVVMHYINNLIQWGDNLFKQYTIEDINEAEMLYVMAYDLLGKAPRDVAGPKLPAIRSLEEILESNKKSLDTINEFLVSIEQTNSSNSIMLGDTPANYIPGDYFGIPENTHFKSYWDTVKTRLYDIRNSLNIKGQLQQPPLFQPALNPAALVAQVASGDATAALQNAAKTSIPYYRFSTMLQKAKEVTSTVIQFGNSLLSTLEKKDAASLALLYNMNQQHIQALTKTSKQDALSQAKESVKAIEAGKVSAELRLQYYTKLIENGWIPAEVAQVSLEGSSIAAQTIGQGMRDIAAVAYNIPTVFGFAVGGSNPGGSIAAIGQGLSELGGIMSTSAGLSGTVASFYRRAEEWHFQKGLAENEVNQATNQLLGAQYQVQMAEQEIAILEKSIAQDQKVERFLKNKFTNEQLYDWMVGKLSALYFQAYQLANDFAVQAQHAWAFEKGISIDGKEGFQPFVQNGHWDNLHQGLLAGEALQLDLQRMESAYMKQDQRRLEITKTIVLSSDFKDPKDLSKTALQELQETGKCVFELKQEDFDNDYDGHYCRQIKSVSVSIPAVLGPYQNIHATLTQTSNTVYLKPGKGKEGYPVYDFRNNQQIAISHGVNDSGMFQLNFNDPRYLPFEGTGAISKWQLDIPHEQNPKLTENKDGKSALTISEVIIEIKYTALV